MINAHLIANIVKTTHWDAFKRLWLLVHDFGTDELKIVANVFVDGIELVGTLVRQYGFGQLVAAIVGISQVIIVFGTLLLLQDSPSERQY